jgi:hypothetical protein
MSRRLWAALSIVLLALGLMPGALAEEAHVAPVREVVEARVRPWISDPLLVAAVKAQNAANAGLTEENILALDQTWRSEVESDAHPMIDAVLSNPLSQFLRRKQDESEGTITEIFVTDARGLNVGQSDVTSDYWQGDEEKFTRPMGMGPGGIFIDVAERDESTQMLQSQASLTISDENGQPIGVITVGVNLDQL